MYTYVTVFKLGGGFLPACECPCACASHTAHLLSLPSFSTQEFSARGVTVNAVCPGFIESDMTEKLDLEVRVHMGRGRREACRCTYIHERNFIPVGPMRHTPQQQAIKKAIPLGRLGKASEISGMVRFLAVDPAAAYITGHSFNVDGGIAIGST